MDTGLFIYFSLCVCDLRINHKKIMKFRKFITIIMWRKDVVFQSPWPCTYALFVNRSSFTVVFCCSLYTVEVSRDVALCINWAVCVHQTARRSWLDAARSYPAKVRGARAERSGERTTLFSQSGGKQVCVHIYFILIYSVSLIRM